MSSSSEYDKPEPIAFGDRELSDVTLIVDEQEFLVHKMVLASRCDYFNTLFYDKKANEDRIEVDDIPLAAFQLLLEILYYGTVKNREILYLNECQASNTNQRECYNCCRYKSECKACSRDRTKLINDIWGSSAGSFWLLEVADRFNLIKMVDHELRDAFAQITCRNEKCFRCICIYLFLVDRDVAVPANRTFDQSTVARLSGMIAEETKRIAITEYSFGNEYLSDVTLVVRNHEFDVHKMTLASRSDVFKVMFYGQFKEANQTRIEIKEVAVTTFLRLMEILYYGTVKNRDSLVPSNCAYNPDGDAPNPGSYRKKVTDEIWGTDSAIFQLLEVADRFNLTQMTVKGLKDACGQIRCLDEKCFRCICLYLFLVDRDGAFTSINRTFDRSTMVEAAKVITGEGMNLTGLLDRLEV